MRAASAGLLAFLSVAVGLYAALGYSAMPLGALVHPDMKAGFSAHPAGVYAHVYTAMLALLLGPLQFSDRLRRTRPALHRWSGRVYLLVGVLGGGLSGLYLAQYAYGGPVAQAGFAALALCWLYTGVRAFLAIRRRDVESHRRWMVRNYALAFAAVMLRLYIPAAVMAGVDFALAYALIAWLCWLPNLVLAERLYQGTRARSGGSVNTA